MVRTRAKELLDDWRDLERRIVAADPSDRDALAAEVQAARTAYFRAVESIWLAVRESDEAATTSSPLEERTPSDSTAEGR